MPDRQTPTAAVPSQVRRAPTIVVFDSGVGGLTVYREIAQARPDARFIYVADDAVFPYGELEDARLVRRLVGLIGQLIADYCPDLVVIACNTASTVALPALRARFRVPFVGTVPAIKPACAASRSRQVSVLGTKATVKREYTRSLIAQFAGDCEVTLVGSARLAPLAQDYLYGESVTDAAIFAEIAPCFVGTPPEGTDTVVLACTHYPLLRDRFEALAPWPVRFLDPAPAIARRVLALSGLASSGPKSSAQAFFTAGRPGSTALLNRLHSYGFGEIDGLKAAV